MADRYWVGGTGTWDSSAGTKWAATSGGAGGASLPTAADDVYFDANSGSGTVTLNATRVCRSLDFTGFAGTFSQPNNTTLQIGGATARADGVALKMPTNYVRGGSVSNFQFLSTAAAQLTVDFKGKMVGSVTFNGAGGSWLLTGDVNCAGATMTLTAGALDTNGRAIGAAVFNSSNSNARSLSLGASVFTLTNVTNAWVMVTITNLTFNVGTSTIIFTSVGGNSTMQPGALTYHNIEWRPAAAGNFTWSTALTCQNFTAVAAAANDLQFNASLIVNGTCTLQGASHTARLLLRSNTLTAQRTLTVNGPVVAQYVDFRDILVTGTSSPLDLSAITGGSGDCQGNSGVTFTPAGTFYRVGGTSDGLWSNASLWSLSSGGAANGRVPLPQDTAIVDDNSGLTSAGTDVSVNVARIGSFISQMTTGSSASFGNSAGVEIYGSFVLTAHIVLTANAGAWTFVGRTAQTIDQAGSTFVGATSINSGNNTHGGYTLASALRCSGALSFTTGRFSDGGFNITASTIAIGNGSIAVTAGATTWTVTGTSGVISFNDSGTASLTSNAAWTIDVTNTSATARWLDLGKAVRHIRFTVPSTARLEVNTWGSTATSTAFSSLTVTGGGKTLQFKSAATTARTYNISGGLTIQGDSGNPIVVQSSIASRPATLSASSAVPVDVRYVSLKDSAATGGATFTAYDSTDAGGNTGWAFEVSGAEEYAGSSTTTVTVDAQGAGRTDREGGGTAQVNVDGQGSGRTVKRGAGSTAQVAADAQGAGSSGRAEGSTAAATADALASGRSIRRGASTAQVEVDASGAGAGPEAGGATTVVEVDALALGRSVRRGGSTAAVSVSAFASGRGSRRGRSLAVVAADAQAGEHTTARSGSGTSAVAADALALGAAVRVGASTAVVAVTTFQFGYDLADYRDLEIVWLAPERARRTETATRTVRAFAVEREPGVRPAERVSHTLGVEADDRADAGVLA